MESGKYSLALRIIHWLMAVFMIGMLSAGFYMKSLPVSNEIKFSFYAIHKTCGITLLGLIIIRIPFRIFTYVPPFPASSPKFIITITKKTLKFIFFDGVNATIWLRYVFSFWYKNKDFFHIPLIINKNKELSIAANELHSLFAYSMIFFITLHILGALKHIFVDKQNILKRII